jgi:hypothetical protein
MIKTAEIVLPLLTPFIELYGNNDADAHPRSALKLLWDRIPYTQKLTFLHDTKVKKSDTEIKAFVRLPNKKEKQRFIFSQLFKTREKNKVRAFYRVFSDVVKSFVDKTELEGENRR